MAEEPAKSHSRSRRTPQFIAAIVVNFSTFCNGVLIGWPSVAIPILQSPDSPLEEPMTNEEVTLVATFVCLVALLSISFINIFSAKFGNKILGYVTGAAFIINGAILVAARTKTWIYVSRIIGGFASACTMSLCPGYVKEIAEDEIRGILGVFFILMFNTGFLYINGVAAFLSYDGIAIAYLIPSIIFLLCFIRMPETPVFLLMQGKNKEATKSLQVLRGKNEDITEELSLLKDSLKTSSDSAEMSLKEMLTDQGTRLGLLIVVVLCANGQLSGIYVFLTYLGSIFLESGSHLSHITAAVIVAALQLVGSVLSSFLVENVGRRLLMILSNVIMAICLAALGIYFYLKELEIDVSSFSWLPVASLSVYMVALSIGLGPLPFVVLTEICLPAAIKVASTVGCLGILISSNFLSFFFKSISVSLGLHVSYFFFAVCCTLGAIFIYFLVPETKGRPVKEIYLELSGRKTSSSDKNNSYVYTPASTKGGPDVCETVS